MRYRDVVATALIMSLAVAGAAGAKQGAVPVHADSNLTETADAFFKGQSTGGVVLVTRGDQVLLRRAYGLSDVENAVPMRPDSALRLASISKQFTAVAVLQLVQAGKLGLDSTLASLDPALAGPMAGVTVQQLLTHTSGIKNISGIAASRAARREDADATRLIGYFKDLPLEFAPGSQFRYSNSNYILLTHLIERLDGRPYPQYMQQAVFQPLGMSHTRYDNHLALIPRRAHGYRRVKGELQNADFISMSQPQGAGGLISTVDDLAIWHRALRDGRLVPPALFAQATGKTTLTNGRLSPYGFGWIIGQVGDLPDVEHGGFINGFNSYVVRVKAPDVFVAVLTNAEFMDPTNLSVRLAAIAAGRPYPAEDTTRNTDTSWTGRYVFADGGARVVLEKDGALQLQQEGDDPVALRPHRDGRHYLDGGLDSLEFGRDAQGRATITLHDRLMGDSIGVRANQSANAPKNAAATDSTGP